LKQDFFFLQQEKNSSAKEKESCGEEKNHFVINKTIFGH